MENKKIQFRLILKDSENRAVLFEVGDLKELGSGKVEKKLLKAYKDVLEYEKENFKKENKEVRAKRAATKKKEAERKSRIKTRKQEDNSDSKTTTQKAD